MDIVERLRQRIALVKFDSDAIALHDAADTIEQLRGQVDFERECREDTYADLEKQDAEIERLREALVEAEAELIYLRRHGKDGARWEANDSKDVWRGFAREALKEKE